MALPHLHRRSDQAHLLIVWSLCCKLLFLLLRLFQRGISCVFFVVILIFNFLFRSFLLLKLLKLSFKVRSFSFQGFCSDFGGFSAISFVLFGKYMCARIWSHFIFLFLCMP